MKIFVNRFGNEATKDNHVFGGVLSVQSNMNNPLAICGNAQVNSSVSGDQRVKEYMNGIDAANSWNKHPFN